MTTKFPTLNISVFVSSWVSGFEKPGQTRSPCVFVALLRCAHTLTCIIRGLYLHASTDSCMSTVDLSNQCLKKDFRRDTPWNHAENLSENPSSCTDLKDPRSGVDYSCEIFAWLHSASLRKSFVMDWFERSTVWCWLLVLKMSSSVAAHTINPDLLDCEDTTPLLRPIFRRPLRWLLVVPTLGGNFLRTWKRMDGLHTLWKK